MKTTTFCRGVFSRGWHLFAGLLCAVALSAFGKAAAEAVDTELLLLVDVSNGGLKKGEFDTLMDGYASALTSSQVIDSIQSGTIGRIGVSLVFFGGDPIQPTGVSWMSIGSLSEAQTFADQLRGLAEPSGGNFTYADSLAYATTSFGTETGGAAGNGFESSIQIIEVAGASKPNGNSAAVDGATAAALAAGVDQIGATAISNKANVVESYYAAHVIGGTVAGTPAAVATTDLATGFEQILADQLSGSVGAAAVVPEPSPALLFLSSMAFLCIFVRSRRYA